MKEAAMKNRMGRRMNAIFAALIVLLVAAVFLINAIALILSNRYPLSVDLTANAAYEIGEETKAVLDALTKSVQIDVLASETSFAGDAYLVQAKRILDRYPQYSGYVQLRYVDYAADPTYAANHADLTLTDGDILVSCGERQKQLPLTSLFNYAYTASESLAVESSRAEEAVTGAILQVLSEEQTNVAVLRGNGEQDVENFVALLVNNNFTLTSAVLSTDPLDDYDALLLAAPQTDLSGDDIRKLEAFLVNGGAYGKTLFYTASGTQPELPNLETFLAEWGVSVGSGAVFETNAARTYQYQPYYPTAGYESEAYRDEMIDADAPVLMPVARPLNVLFTAKDAQITETLLGFSETAGVRPADAGTDFKVDDAEQHGPMPALALCTRRISGADGAKTSYVVVSASTEMLSALSLQNSSLGNARYLLHVMNKLTEREETVTIQPKSLSGKTLGITTAQVTTLGVLLGGVLPLLILLTGVGVWLYRRYQ